ncbi:Metallo-dependent hydrolase [Bimuria novae-zelandiae CBS 107.79]|uniref:Metallo-dependent hydrolase n=1 Tax=Bimuria novae-zelandiae CBS 107.79 TaxID=1447943 RepID=A0A6A5UKN1_9PLEO|nr:Metallo-dependent hydrolase [Bimuria novae-zelandiae CBS 107.79]
MAEDSAPKSCLFVNATIVTVNKEQEVILDGALLVENGRIATVGKTQDLLPKFDGEIKAKMVEVIECRNKIIIPGLINTHAHLAQSILRGLAEDLNLHEWLCDAIWPLVANYAEEDGYVAAMCTIVKMLKTGTTCFLEAMLTHRSGLKRSCLGKLAKVEVTNAKLNMKDARDRDVAALDAHREYNGTANDRIHIWQMALTMHCAEAPKDLTVYWEQYHCSPFQFCRENQLTGEKSVFAHVVHPDPEADMVAAGVNVALGTDGAPCNNTYDLFREMHLASILHGGVRQDAGVPSAYQVLEFATINGARALGLEEKIGSLEDGKKADIVVVVPKGVQSAPWDASEQTLLAGGINPVTILVHGSGIKVESVLVDGRFLVRNGTALIRSGVRARNHMSLKYS